MRQSANERITGNTMSCVTIYVLQLAIPAHVREGRLSPSKLLVVGCLKDLLTALAVRSVGASMYMRIMQYTPIRLCVIVFVYN